MNSRRLMGAYSKPKDRRISIAARASAPQQKRAAQVGLKSVRASRCAAAPHVRSAPMATELLCRSELSRCARNGLPGAKPSNRPRDAGRLRSQHI